MTIATDPEVSSRLVEALRDLWTDPSPAAALHEPFFGGNENAYVRECIDTGWVSSVGKFVDRFEHDLAAFTGAGRAVAVAKTADLNWKNEILQPAPIRHLVEFSLRAHISTPNL